MGKVAAGEFAPGWHVPPHPGEAREIGCPAFGGARLDAGANRLQNRRNRWAFGIFSSSASMPCQGGGQMRAALSG